MMISNNDNIESYIDNILIPKLVQETAKNLNNSQNELQKIKWTEGEANTDTEYSFLAREKAEEAFRIVQSNFQSNFNLKIETSSPDLTIKLIFKDCNNKSKIYHRKVELKSGKTKIIPGSTIRNLDINSWVIFVLREDNNSRFSFRYGRYYKGILVKDTELFQDRTPRPSLIWDNYQDIHEKPDVNKIDSDKQWINKYAKAAIYRAFLSSEIKQSWQDDLVKLIIKYVLEDEDILNKVINDLNINKDELKNKLDKILN